MSSYIIAKSRAPPNQNYSNPIDSYHRKLGILELKNYLNPTPEILLA